MSEEKMGSLEILVFEEKNKTSIRRFREAIDELEDEYVRDIEKKMLPLRNSTQSSSAARLTLNKWYVRRFSNQGVVVLCLKNTKVVGLACARACTLDRTMEITTLHVAQDLLFAKQTKVFQMIFEKISVISKDLKMAFVTARCCDPTTGMERSWTAAGYRQYAVSLFKSL